MEQTRLRLLKLGALLLFLGMLTGLYLGAALTGKIPADGKIVLGAHLNAILGSFILFGLAFCLPYLRYEGTGRNRLAWAMIVANYANWLITGIKALLNVHGLDFTGNAANDVVFVLLTLFVVIPSLVGTFFWFRGFRES